MVTFFIVSACLCVCAYAYGYWSRKNQYGFFIALGEFGAGKTLNTTAYLFRTSKKFQVNATNYYTGYTDFQLSSHLDLVNYLNDVYDYHQFVNLLPDVKKLHTFKQSHVSEYLKEFRKFLSEVYPGSVYLEVVDEYLAKLPDSGRRWSHLDELVGVLRQQGYFGKMRSNLKFNVVLDEGSIYFNPRNFEKNFRGVNERLLDFIYQPRKLNLLMFVVVQSPMELDVKFRRLATYYRKYYKGLGFWRWFRDFYFMDPEQIDLEKAEHVGGGPIFGGTFHLTFKGRAIWPKYDYHTKELIRPGSDVYAKGSLFSHIIDITEK